MANMMPSDIAGSSEQVLSPEPGKEAHANNAGLVIRTVGEARTIVNAAQYNFEFLSIPDGDLKEEKLVRALREEVRILLEMLDAANIKADAQIVEDFQLREQVAKVGNLGRQAWEALVLSAARHAPIIAYGAIGGLLGIKLG